MGLADRIAKRIASHPSVQRGADRLGYKLSLDAQFAVGDKVVLGNGDMGKVLKECVGPTGFKSYRVQVTSSAASATVGRRVYATCNGMAKLGHLVSDIVASFHTRDGDRIATVVCEAAVDDQDQRVGLQKYSSLPTGSGMLFPYDPPRQVMFHMGSVQFPIDVIFINNRGTITNIQHNRLPGVDECWGSNSRVAGVLEVNGGFCSGRDINIGDTVRISVVKTAQESAQYPYGARTDAPVHALPNKGLGGSPAPEERFKGRGETPDQVLSPDASLGIGKQPLDINHFDTQQGYDPTQTNEEFLENTTTRPGPGV